MTKDKINEIQLFLQMYDKGIISKKTVLEKTGINAEEELAQIQQEHEQLYGQQVTPTTGMGNVENVQQYDEPY